jgi:hypothetical protein
MFLIFGKKVINVPVFVLLIHRVESRFILCESRFDLIVNEDLESNPNLGKQAQFFRTRN